MKLSNKILAAMITVLLVISVLPAASLAAETASTERVAIGSFTSGTVTITASNADDSFALYKVVDITYDATSNELTYAFTADAAAYAAALTTPVTIDTYQGWANDSTELKTFLGGYAAYVKANSVTADKTGAAVAGTCTITGAELGQYMVLGTGSSTGAYIYQIMTATFKPDDDYKVNTGVSLTSKASTPTIDKTVDDQRVAYGDVATYTVEVTVPTYPAAATNRKYTVTDTLPTGLTWKEGVSVKGVTGETKTDISVTPSVNGQVITWAFTDFDAIKSYEKIEIIYKANVTNALPITTGGTNLAELEYSNDPYGTGTYKINDKVTVYTYEIEVEKVDKTDNTKKLAGVVFELYKGTSANDCVAANLVDTVTTGTDGIAEFKGLDVGSYMLKEKATINGYLLLKNPISITVADDDIDGKIDTDGIYKIKVENEKGEFSLPTTGGMGIYLFSFAGIALMALAVVLLSNSRKKSMNN